MINQASPSAEAVCVCPECKNTIDLAKYPSVETGMVIECNHCGMTLLVKSSENGQIETEIVDEGK